MNEYFKYLTTSEEDINWGLYLKVAGYARIKANTMYPPREHPSEYYFEWKSGRILHEFQLNYITEGTGIFENANGKFQVKPGSLIVIFPNEWHRYRPTKKTGWVENYVGFNGHIADQLLKHPTFSSQQPVIQCGIREEIIDTYLKISDLVEKERPGYQQIASGMVVKLLGYIISFEKRKGFSGKQISKVIEEVRFLMRQNAAQEFDLEELARQHNVGYSYFRKMFKKYTGVSPGQYHLQLRIIRAKELLISTDKSIKEISLELGFQTIHYFSLIFKKKVGMNPSEFRKRLN
ncbi:AraC family transcriptional regulator [uncultured Draconibacterium sp.]|uniref:AraC family transcriptional regulator n=1 Tax=uncultured Draconibacterium sp. TaxID=1573823 RepID=UPI0025FCB2B1|nr:AraC family transcriptional regulator [uncultured Draconibacterium sp.]